MGIRNLDLLTIAFLFHYRILKKYSISFQLIFHIRIMHNMQQIKNKLYQLN